MRQDINICVNKTLNKYRNNKAALALGGYLLKIKNPGF